MPIDFAKYGGTNAKEKKKTGISLDFSKYDDSLPTSDRSQANKQYADQMKAAYKSNPDSFNVKPVAKTIVPQKDPTWNGPLDNPITRTAGKGLAAVGKAYDKVSHLPVINQATGAMQGLIEPLVHNDAPAKEEPLWKKYLGNVADTYNVAQNIINPASLITGNLIPSKSDKSVIEKGKALLQAPKSAIQGAFNPDEARKRMEESLQSRSFVDKLVIGSAADPLSYVPLPSVRGIKTASSAVGDAFERFAARNKDAPIDFEQYMQASKNRNEVSLGQIDRGEQGIVDKFNFMERQTNKNQPLQLNPSRAEVRQNAAQARSTLQPNTRPIQGRGNVETMTLPASNTPRIINDIKKQADTLIKPPTNRRGLITYAEQHLEVPKAELIKMNDKDLYELGQMIRSSTNMDAVQAKLAVEQGHNWTELVSGKSVTGNVESPLNRLQFTPKAERPKPLIGSGGPVEEIVTKTPKAKPRATIEAFVNGNKEVAATTVKPRVAPIARVEPAKPKAEAIQQARTTTVLPDEKIKGQQLKDLKTGDETSFAQTVRNSETTPSELARSLYEQSITGSRTTDVLNRQEAAKLIEKHGFEGLHSKLISKTKQFSASETVAAQVLAKHFSSLGGKENLSKAIDLVSKTAKGGREMGQAIQALSQWNKLDSEGALLVGTRQLNKGEKDLTQWKDLTPEQAAPITAATKRIGEAQATKDLADEVLTIVTNKKAGEALTDVEKATVKEFHAKIKEINEKGKGILSKPKADKANETIEKVSKIEPKARTRDQVVSFLDAKAEKARQRIAASRNRISSTPFDIYRDYAIIGASHIAKGAVKLSDFSAAMVRDFGDTVKPHINDAFNKATNIFRKENGLPTVEHLDRVVNAAVKNERFTPEQASQFKAWASEIGHYADKNLKIEATQDLQRALNDIGTSTLGDKLAATQTAAQLLSVPTLVRNVVGNEAFNIVQKINKVNAVPIDWALSKFTGERTVVFHAKNQESYWNNFVKGLEGGWKGVSPNGQFESYGIHPSAFKSNKNPLKYMQKALGAELQSFDHAAYMRAYGRTLGEYSKITGKNIEDLDQAIFDLADEAGRYATFQDDTFLSKLAVGTKSLLNKPTDLLADALVHKGVLPESLSWKGFGTGDLILKYAKTPANIVMRGIDYSPIGFMRGIGELLPLITGKAFNQRAATMALSRGITGTLGMTGLGYALVSSGVLTGKSSMDADIRSLDQQTGKGEYKVNWSALSRYIEGGLDKNAAQWKKGDNITDWGWLQPMAISISMGVNAQQSVDKQRTEGTNSYVGVAKDALIGSLKTIMQQPLLSGVQNLVSGVTNVMRYGSWTGIANIFKGMPASFVPAALNQTRNYSDNTTRNTYDPSTLKEALNMITNKIPGLSKKLPIAYDTLGGKREQIQGGQNKSMEQGLKTFASPVKVTDYVVSPEAKMIMDLINSTGNETVAPRTPKKFLMVNKKKIELTPKQYSDLQKNTGEATQKALTKIANYLSSDTHTDDQKIKKVVDTLNDVGDTVRKQLNKDYPELKPLTAQQLRKRAK